MSSFPHPSLGVLGSIWGLWRLSSIGCYRLPMLILHRCTPPFGGIRLHQANSIATRQRMGSAILIASPIGGFLGRKACIVESFSRAILTNWNRCTIQCETASNCKRGPSSGPRSGIPHSSRACRRKGCLCRHRFETRSELWRRRLYYGQSRPRRLVVRCATRRRQDRQSSPETTPGR